MRRFAVFACTIAAVLIVSVSALPQLVFDGPSSSGGSDDDTSIRAGLLATDLGLSPTGIDPNDRERERPGEEPCRHGLLASCRGRDPVTGEEQGEEAVGRINQGDYCCCASTRSTCPSGQGGQGGSFIDAINPRGTPTGEIDEPRSAGDYDDDDYDDDVSVRIVNDPIDDEDDFNDDIQRCPQGTQRCCYVSRSARDQVRNQCRTIDNGGSNEFWRQSCEDRDVRRGTPNGFQCGERFPVENSDRPLEKGQAKPYEFPWTCLVLKGNNDFLGTCAIIPSNGNNDISQGTDRVITAAHKLKNVGKNDLIKVRIIEYDASGFNNPETESHQEFTVTRFKNHPRYNDKRLNHDVALLFLNQRINLISSKNVNAACLPKCADMFDYTFTNGTGTRCWVAGWGKDREGGNFQFIQKKVDVPIVPDRFQCDNSLRGALQRQGTNTDRFSLDDSELCAGGEEGKDACEGDGGAPLVCQADNQRWYVVGLVTWGVGCANRNVPGVYANIHNMLPFILGN